MDWKTVVALAVCNLASAAWVAGAVAILLAGGDAGWGWLLVVAVLLSHGWTKSDDE